MKRTVLMFGILVLLKISLVGQQPSSSKVNESTSKPEEKIGKEFPYNIQLQDADGQIVNSSTLFKKHKKATVLLFWVTTCRPCREELAAISEKFKQWKKQTHFEFYAISMDVTERIDKFNKIVKESNWPFPAYHDIKGDFKAIMDGGLVGLPQIFVLDKKGQIVYHTKKYESGDEDKLFEIIKGI